MYFTSCCSASTIDPKGSILRVHAIVVPRDLGALGGSLHNHGFESNLLRTRGYSGYRYPPGTVPGMRVLVHYVRNNAPLGLFQKRVALQLSLT